MTKECPTCKGSGYNFSSAGNPKEMMPRIPTCPKCGGKGTIPEYNGSAIDYSNALQESKQDPQPSLEDMPSFEVESEEQKWVDLILAACRTDQDDAIDPITLAKRIIREKKQHTHSTLESLREELRKRVDFLPPVEKGLTLTAIDHAIDKEKNES